MTRDAAARCYEPIQATCRHCGSTEITSLDYVESRVPVAGWTRNAHGKLEPSWGCTGGVVDWETDRPVHAAKPYECSSCSRPLGLDDLVVPGHDGCQLSKSLRHFSRGER